MKKLLLLFTITIITAPVYSQRICLGFGLDLGVFSKTNSDSRWVHPSTSYNIYYLSDHKTNTKHYFNQFSLGPSVSIDYKHFFVQAELKYSFTSTKYLLYYPTFSSFSSSFIGITTEEKFLKCPIIIGYKFLARKFTPYIAGGFFYALNIRSNEVMSIEGSDPLVTAFAGTSELYNYAYNFSDFFSPCIDAGIMYNGYYMAARYGRRFYENRNQLHFTISNVELLLGVNFRLDKISKKPSIYYE
jgi:hypothetical protein